MLIDDPKKSGINTGKIYINTTSEIQPMIEIPFSFIPVDE